MSMWPRRLAPGVQRMHTGELVFAQLMGHLPPMVFECRVARYGGIHKVKSFTYMDQYLCMAFAHLTFRESLRDIEVCLRSQAERLYHMGIRSRVSHNTLANANATRELHGFMPILRSA